MFWFARYRSVRETDRLRLRIRLNAPGRYPSTAAAVGGWAQQLCDRGAAARLNFATYRPEIGRYGDGPATAAAETVFAADSYAVLAARQLPAARLLHPQSLTAIGIADIADAFHGEDCDAATCWLLERIPATSAADSDRDATRQVLFWATHPALPAGLDDAWQARRDALARYRRSLPDATNHQQVLSGLVHMHHNRARGVDRNDEDACLHLARRIALARRAHAAESTRR